MLSTGKSPSASTPNQPLLHHRNDPGLRRQSEDAVYQQTESPVFLKPAAYPATTATLTASSKGTSTTNSPAATSDPVELGATDKISRASMFKRQASSSMSTPSRLSRSNSSSNMPSLSKVERTHTPTQRISRAKKGKRVHACTHQGCEKVFTRAEHLRRHQLNHSTEVVYRCDMCEKTFVRQDLLSRHNERHASQARKALATLEMASRHRQFSSFGLGLGPGPSQVGEYGGNTHVFDSASHGGPRMHSGVGTLLPQIMSGNSSHHSSPTASVVTMDCSNSIDGYAPPPYPNSISQSDSTLEYTSAESTPSPSASLRRPHLPFHLQHNEPHRQPDQYLLPPTTHPEAPRRMLGGMSGHNNHYTPRSAPPSENYDSLFNTGNRTAQIMDHNQDDHTQYYMDQQEATYYQEAGSGYDVPKNQTEGIEGPNKDFHPLDEEMMDNVLFLLSDTPVVDTEAASADSMQSYLRLYWTQFHPMYPLLHRPTFFPSAEMNNGLLVAMMLAIGASYSGGEANNFAMELHDKVRGCIVNSEEFSAHSPANLYVQQVLLLTDMFGKLRSRRAHLDTSELQLDHILASNLRRNFSQDVDLLAEVRQFIRGGVKFSFQEHWIRWVHLEARKRVAIIFFLWDAQQTTLFGRDMLLNVFNLKVKLPCEEFLWSADSAVKWANMVDGQLEYPSFLDLLKIFLDGRRTLPVLSPLCSLLVLHGLISIGLDLQRLSSSANFGLSPQETTVKQQTILQGLDTWKQQFDDVAPSILIEPWYQRAMTTYHMAFIMLNSNVHYILALAGDRRYIKEMVPFAMIKRELQQWASVSASHLGTWHAIQILLRYLRRPQLYEQDLYVPWCAYIAAMICWAYGVLAPKMENEQDMWESQDDHEGMRNYLNVMNTDDWTHLRQLSPDKQMFRPQTRGLLYMIRHTLEAPRWELIKDSIGFLKGLDPDPERAVKGEAL